MRGGRSRLGWFVNIGAAGHIKSASGLRPWSRGKPWVSALYGAIMIGWGLTLLLIGRVAFRRNDAELRVALMFGIALWLTVEGAFSAYFRIWFNVGVDVAVLALFSFPLLRASRSEESKPM